MGVQKDSIEKLYWVEAVVFAAFLVISLVWELSVHALEHRLHHKNRHGLLALLQALKTELLLYGLLSLLLAMAQPGLAQICVSAAVDTSADTCKACSKYPIKCPSGTVEALPYKTAYNIHVLIFMVAMSHMTMALLSMAASLLKMRRWRKWASIPKDVLEPIHEEVLETLGSNCCTHWLWAFVNQWFMRVRKPTFLGIRRFFLEQLVVVAGLQALPDFPYNHFLQYLAENYLARLVSLDWYMWVFAVALVLVPDYWQQLALYALTIVSLVVLLVCGTVIQSAAVKLAAKAELMFGGAIRSGCSHPLPRHFPDVADLEADLDQTRSADPRQAVPESLRKSHAQLEKVTTTRELFWFKKPALLLVLYKLAYFQVSFAFAYMLFKLVVEKEKDVLKTNVMDPVTDAVKKAVPFFSVTVGLVVLLVLATLVILHSSWRILPTFTLCMSTSKETQEFVRKYMEMLKGTEAASKPAVSYLIEELHLDTTLSRLESMASEQGSHSHSRSHSTQRQGSQEPTA